MRNLTKTALLIIPVVILLACEFAGLTLDLGAKESSSKANTPSSPTEEINPSASSQESTSAEETNISEGGQSCRWEFVEIKEAFGTSDSERMSVSRSGNTMTTSFITPASDFCGETDFKVTHTWTEPPTYLTPGETLTFLVDASWSLNGSNDCNNTVTGLNTNIYIGATLIIARREKVITSNEPTGSISNSGTWTVYYGEEEGSRLWIKAHGEQGGAAGTVTYWYQYVCGDHASTATETPKSTQQPGMCYPKVYNIDNLKPGDVLSPAADYFDENGAPVGIIGQAWVINGEPRSSVVWDGKETRLELQYTCLDHSGHIKEMTIPAYGAPETAASGENPEVPPKSVDQSGQTPSLPTAASVAGLVIGLAGAGISGGAIIKNLLDSKKEKLPEEEKTPKSQSSDSTSTEKVPEKKETGKESAKSEKKKETREEKKERKGLLDSEKEAIEEYKNTLEKISGNVGDAIEMIENMESLSPESRKRVLDELNKFKESLDNVTEKAGNISDKLEKLQKIRDDLIMLNENYKRIQKAHMEAFKELKELPEGAAHQLADLTTAIEGFGIVADEVFKRIPYFKQIYSNEYFETTNSFREFGKGVRKNLSKTVFRTAVEAKKEFTVQERIEFGEKGLEYRQDPEIQKLIRERKRAQAKQAENSIWKKVHNFLFGKEVPPEIKSFR